MLAGIREQLIARRTQLSNAIRGYAAEFGLVAAKGLDKIEPLLAQIAQEENLPALARELFAMQGHQYAQLQAELKVDRSQADGLASRQRHQPPPGADSGAGADRCHDAGNENA